MGGIMFIIGIIAALAVTVAVAAVNTDTNLAGELFSSTGQQRIYVVRIFAGVIMAISFGFVGFIDDYIKVVKKRNLGLTTRQKTMLQLLIAAGYLSTLALQKDVTTWIPFVGNMMYRTAGACSIGQSR